MNKRVQIRTAVRQQRQQLSNEEQRQASMRLKERLIRHKKIINAQRIALYLANDSELDTLSFIQWCWQQGKEVYLPVLHPFCLGHLLFLRYEKSTSMAENMFGILEPKLDVTKVCPLAELDIICAPLVAFDNTGARLGMGGGFYDRSLAHWQQTKLYPLGLAHDCQLVESIPIEIWDIPLPEIITPSKIYHFS